MQHGRMRLQVNAHQDTLARDVHIGDRILVEVHGYCDDAIGIQPARGQEVVPSLGRPRSLAFSVLRLRSVFRRSTFRNLNCTPPHPPAGARGAFVRGGERGDPGKPGHAAHTHSRIVNAPGAGGGARSTCIRPEREPTGDESARSRGGRCASLTPMPSLMPMPPLSAHAPSLTPMPLSLRPSPLSPPMPSLYASMVSSTPLSALMKARHLVRSSRPSSPIISWSMRLRQYSRGRRAVEGAKSVWK